MSGILMADVAERPGIVALDGDALDRRRVRAEQRADGVAGLVRGQHALLRAASASADPTHSVRARSTSSGVRGIVAAVAQPEAGDRPAQGVEVVAAERRAGCGVR